MNDTESMKFLEQQINALWDTLTNLKNQFSALKDKTQPQEDETSPAEEQSPVGQPDGDAGKPIVQEEQQPTEPVVADTPMPAEKTGGESATKQAEEASHEAEGNDKTNRKGEDTQACLLKKMDELASKLAEMQDAVNNITNEFMLKVDRLESDVDDKQEKLEYIIQNVQEDRYRKDKMRLLNRCIFQAELVRKTIYEYPTQSEHIEDKEEYLLGQLREVVTGLETSLQYEGVEARHFAAVGEKVNPQYQEVISVVETDDEAKDGTVAESVNPGYVWTLPYILKAKVNSSGDEIKTYMFLMREEQVVAYKFTSKQ